METAYLPVTPLERSQRALEAITRGWFLGYSWHQDRHHSDGHHLLLLPDRKMRGIEEARLGALVAAFESIGLNSRLTPMKVMRHWIKASNGNTLEIVHPNAEFLENNHSEIRQRFERRLRQSAGRYSSETHLTPGC